MRCHTALCVAALIVLAALTTCPVRAEAPAAPAAIWQSDHPTFKERLAAQEVRRYVYLRTGQLLPIITDLKAAPDGGLIFVGHTCRCGRLITDGCTELRDVLDQSKDRNAEWYLLKTFQHNGRPVLVVVGGNPLYPAYRLAEHLGVRFYMHGDVVPDTPIAWKMPQLDEQRSPLFDRRGIQPFHDFPEGPDWWSADDYKAILAQLPKMGMNFFGLHTYPEGGVGPEPLTWIGLPQDVNDDGTVKFAYPSRHFTTSNVTGAWGYRPMKTSDYVFGAAALFDRDDFGADYMQGTEPWNRMSPEQSAALFDRMGRTLNESFTLAHELGIHTCIGTETPLTIPGPVRERLKAAGKDPADPAVIQEVYEGMFERIVRTHPLDYYWFWTPEGWTWSETGQADIDATQADLRAAIAAAEKVGAPFTLATCGWVLGPGQDRALFDNFLPKNMPMSCINRQVGHDPVEPGFANVKGRPKWAIPWMEDDPALCSPQLWAGRMRKDGADALAYGCTGLLGIHWRTRILGPNVSALAKAAWDQKGWNPALGAPAAPKVRVPEGPVAGQPAQFPNNAIAETDDDPLYQTVRYDVDAYNLDVPNGAYTVTLKFCEPHYAEKGRRVFGVKLQGKTVIDRLDIFEKVGKDKALDFTFKDVQVTDGRLAIDFVRQVEFPSIAAIVVEGPVTRKINCGGPAYKDFQADWPASAFGTTRNRFLPVGDFYADWALAQFGPEVAEPAAKIFNEIDGRLPRPTNWVNGPGGIAPDGRPWDEVAREFAFVDDLAALRPQVRGPGNLERFDYWLNNFRYMRSNAQVNCTWARFNAAIEKAKTAATPEAKKKAARDLALPVRKELVAQAAEMHRYLLATVTTYGELGNVTNWQQHDLPMLLYDPGQELAKLLGEDLPADAVPGKDYQGEPRLFVPTVRTSLVSGEPLRLTAMVAGAQPASVDLCWRPLGTGQFTKVPLAHVARGVWRVTLPAETATADLEYYIQAPLDGGRTLFFPPTAPQLNQTVVVVGEK